MDRYSKYQEDGDQFVGRCCAGLPQLIEIGSTTPGRCGPIIDEVSLVLIPVVPATSTSVPTVKSSFNVTPNIDFLEFVLICNF